MTILRTVLALAVLLLAVRASAAEELVLDHATYNLSSLVLHKKHWLDEDLKTQGVEVRWVFSAGSNKANEFIASGSAHIASTAGAAALLARTNGVPLKVVYVYAKPEWSQLIVAKDSTLTGVEQLKGRKIAVTRGTDPFFFLLRSLAKAGLTQKDVELVNLQHGDGYTALVRGNVDAWSGLDPFIATAELKDGAKPLYRNPDFLSYGTLNVQEDYLAKHPERVRTVIAAYEKARNWIIANPDEAAGLLAEYGKLDPAVAKRQLTARTDLVHGVGIPGEALTATLSEIAPIIAAEKLGKTGSDPVKALAELIDAGPATAAIGASGR